jgi:hypothetical protein
MAVLEPHQVRLVFNPSQHNDQRFVKPAKLLRLKQL